jgi:hypothetical protein
VLIALTLLVQSYGVVAYRPCYLSYYNLFVGGLGGANRIGLEPTYWSDSFTRDFLEATVQNVPAGSRIDVTPVLHHLQLRDMMEQSPILRSHQVRLVPFNSERTRDTKYVMFYHRYSYLPDALRKHEFQGRLVAEVRRDGVPLASLYEWGGFANPEGNRAAPEAPGDDHRITR